MGTVLLAFGVSLGASAAFVRFPSLGRILTRASAAPRWRMDAVPLGGGLAMGAGFGAAVAVFGRDLAGVGAICAAAYLGLAIKVAGQAATGLALAALGVTLDLPGPEVVAWVATIVFVVAVTNAVNLLDNMDGVSGGVALIAAVTLGIWWTVGTGPVAFAAALAGAVAGFLALNIHPAHLFMGDAGSHFLGAALAGLAILDAGRAGTTGDASILAVLLGPVLLLAVPFFDMALVTVERIRHRRPVAEGGSDHTAHRLARMGLGIRTVGFVLWAAAGVAAGVATLAGIDGPWLAIGAAGVAVFGVFAWWHLAPYDPAVATP
jgi:UDP-GlcNAc:undecaprenyl-phosphate GlcNAc-1-phosphate transferase